MSQPIVGVRLYVAWSHNNKNLILQGIHFGLTNEQILNKILTVIKTCKVTTSFRL